MLAFSSFARLPMLRSSVCCSLMRVIVLLRRPAPGRRSARRRRALLTPVRRRVCLAAVGAGGHPHVVAQALEGSVGSELDVGARAVLVAHPGLNSGTPCVMPVVERV